jgi:hypothetical protein
MSIRDRVRNFRLYYKRDTIDLYRKAFTNYSKARWFPFFGSGEFFPRHGKQAGVDGGQPTLDFKCATRAVWRPRIDGPPERATRCHELAGNFS